MKLTYKDFEQVLNIGIELSTEKDRNKLLSGILEKGMEITCCDAATLYLYENEQLRFKIMKTISQEVSRGEQGEEIDMPPVRFEEGNVCAYTAIHRKIVNIPDVYHCEEFDFSGPKKYDALTGYHTQSMLVIPLENNEEELLGVLQLLNAQDKDGKVAAFDSEYEIIIRSLGSLTAIAMTNLRYLEEMKRQLHSFVEAMATAIDERTPYNGTHTRKVAEYSLLLADKINEKYKQGETTEYFDEDRKEKLELAALLHDIGKMIIPRSVMNRATRLDKDMKAVEDRFTLISCYFKIDFLAGKLSQEEYDEAIKILQEGLAFIHRIDNMGFLPDEDYDAVQKLAERYYEREDGIKLFYLTEEERICLSVRKGTLTDEMRQLMESHVVMTSKILSKVYFNKNYKMVPTWAGQHHEFLNGTGYPNHLTAENLTLEARILTVTDIYDALTSTDRPYKKPMPKEKAISILNAMAEEGKIEQYLVNWLAEAVRAQKIQKKESTI